MESRFTSLVPDFLEGLVPYQAGKPIAEVQREYGVDRVIKLASNENPLGSSPRALAAVQEALTQASRYPDAAARDLRGVLAEKYRLSTENVIVGNGSEGIMACIVRAFLHGEDEVITARGTFMGFTVLCRTRGIEPILVPLDNYTFDLEAMADRITERTKLIYLCNPNNPTGTMFTRDQFDRFMDRVPERCLVILDEAYFEFAKHRLDFPDSMDYRHDNVITLRTFSKAYGLAGFRVGYGFGHDHLIRHLWKVKLPFEPAVLGQRAGIAALADDEFLEKTVRLTREGLEFFYGRLKELGLSHVESLANFVLVQLESKEQVTEVFGELLKKGIIVRPLTQYSMADCIRITVGLPDENEACLQALKEVLGK